MPPEWLPSPHSDKAMSDYNAIKEKSSLRVKDMSDNKVINTTIRVFLWMNSAYHPAKAGQLPFTLCFYYEMRKNTLFPMAKMLICRIVGTL